jgi:hypothetical protein
MNGNFNDLPLALRESLLWDMELEYDSYEGSKAETIHTLLNEGWTGTYNTNLISDYWKNLSEENFRNRVVGLVDEHKRSIEQLEHLLDTPYKKTAFSCLGYEPAQQPETPTTVCFKCGWLKKNHP